MMEGTLERPDCTLRPNAGHIANMDNADFTNDALRAFLRRHVGQPEERAA